MRCDVESCSPDWLDEICDGRSNSTTHKNNNNRKGNKKKKLTNNTKLIQSTAKQSWARNPNKYHEVYGRKKEKSPRGVTEKRFDSDSVSSGNTSSSSSGSDSDSDSDSDDTSSNNEDEEFRQGLGSINDSFSLQNPSSIISDEFVSLSSFALSDLDHQDSEPLLEASGFLPLGMMGENDEIQHGSRFSETQVEPIKKLMKKLQAAKETHGFGHRVVADNMVSLADHYMEHEKDFKRALNIYEEAFTIYNKEVGTHSSQAINLQTKIGRVLLVMGNFEVALETLEEAMEKKTNILGADHPEIAGLYEQISLIHDESGQTKLAIQYLTKALHIYRRYYGEKSLKTAHCMESIGSIYSVNGYDKEAISILERVIKIKTTLLGNKNLEVAETLLIWGIALGSNTDQDNSRKALRVLKKSYEMFIELSGKEDTSVAVALFHIGDIYLHQNLLDKAHNAHKKALSIKQKSFGVDMPSLAENYFKVGLIEIEFCHFKKAKLFIEKAKSLYQTKFTETHPIVIETTKQLGIIQFHLGYYNQSLRSFADVLGVTRVELTKAQNRGKEEKIFSLNQEMGDLLCWIGKAHAKENDDKLKLAFNSFISALVYYDKSIGRSEKFADTLVDAGDALSRMTYETENSKKLFRHALKVYKSIGFGEDNPKVRVLRIKYLSVVSKEHISSEDLQNEKDIVDGLNLYQMERMLPNTP